MFLNFAKTRMVGSIRLELTRHLSCLAEKVSSIDGYHRERHPNKLPLVSAITLEGSWRRHRNLSVGSLRSKCWYDCAFVPLVGSSESEILVWYFSSLRVVEWRRVWMRKVLPNEKSVKRWNWLVHERSLLHFLHLYIVSNSHQIYPVYNKLPDT